MNLKKAKIIKSFSFAVYSIEKIKNSCIFIQIKQIICCSFYMQKRTISWLLFISNRSILCLSAWIHVSSFIHSLHFTFFWQNDVVCKTWFACSLLTNIITNELDMRKKVAQLSQFNNDNFAHAQIILNSIAQYWIKTRKNTFCKHHLINRENYICETNIYASLPTTFVTIYTTNWAW